MTLAPIGGGTGQTTISAHSAARWLANLVVAQAATGPPDERLSSTTAPDLGRIGCQRLLGELLRHYDRAA